MKAIAKKPHQDSADKKGCGTVHSAFKNACSPNSDHQTSIIQLKPICPCDGGCPQCAPVIQPKIIIGQPNDKYEKEADRVADEVMRMPEPEVQPKPTWPLSKGPSCGDEDMEEELIQTRPIAEEITLLIQRQPEKEEPIMTKALSNRTQQASDSLHVRLNRSRGGGQPLPDTDRDFMETRFGLDFSNVKVHTNSNAIQMNRKLNAQAFTNGRDIYFSAGTYNPSTSSGKRLLAHELTHVIQQNKYNNGRNVHGTQNPILQHALIQRPLDPSRGFSIPSSRPEAISLSAYFYPLPVSTEQAAEAACTTVEGSPRSYEIDLFRIHGIEQSSDSLIANATLNFFFRHFRDVFILLYFGCRSEVNSDFPDDPERAEEEFGHVIADQVYRRHLFPVAEEYFLNHPDRLRQLRQRRTPRVRRGEELA